MSDLSLDVDDSAALDHLRTEGYVVLRNVLGPGLTSQLRDLVLTIASDEKDEGKAWFSGKNQRLYDLINKDSQFLALALNNDALKLVFGALTPHALLSSITAHIVSPGSSAQELHADQAYIWGPWPHAFVVNVVWMLDEFTAQNGATRVVPRSHLQAEAGRSETLPITGTAGSACILDGRVIHGSGTNDTDRERVSILALYSAPFLRQQENASRSLSPDIRRELSPSARRLLGFDVWKGLGAVNGLPATWMQRADRSGPINTDHIFPDQ